jgi:outer membrane protein assembly factor BamB
MSRLRSVTALILASFTAWANDACGGAFNPAPILPGSPPAKPAQGVPVSVNINIPQRPRGSPNYVSPATKSASITVTPKQGKRLPEAILNCSQSACDGTLYAPPGTATFAVALYDGSNATGSVLSSARILETIVAGRANTLDITVNGVPASVALLLSPSLYTYQSPGTIAISLVARDAGGYTIVGRYASAVTISSSDTSRNSSLSRNALRASGDTITLTYNAAFQGTTITAQGKGFTTVTAPVEPQLTDDWSTFSHDASRTGMETLPTGITPATVSQLQLAWSTSPDNGACEKSAFAEGNFGDEAAPLVWNGLVYYANTCGAVYALSRATGAVVWKTQLRLTNGFASSGVYGTPSIDTTQSPPLLLLPVWGMPGQKCPGASCVPTYGGYLAALNATTGAIVWESTPLNAGRIRGEPFAVGGDVYVGQAGGDSDDGYTEGGMLEYSETTGEKIGFFQVAPAASSDDGGSSWSPISYDGTYIYFGTGNTTNNDGDFDGVIQMRPSNLSPVTDYGTFTGNYNEDVAGGILLLGGDLYFTGKSGYYYAFPISSFDSTPLFAPVSINTLGGGDGPIGGPTTDGNVISVGSGYDSTSPPTSDLILFPVGSSTPRCTVRPAPATTSTGDSPIFSSAAWVKASGSTSGVGFLGMDNGEVSGVEPEFYAFDENCHVLWSANAVTVKGFFYAEPAVVQSGLYAIDNTGNVYAWKLPATMGVDGRGRRVRRQHVNLPVPMYVNARRRFTPNDGRAKGR